MDIHELTYFKKVAELQHMTRAAQELRVAQPALSRTISGLEQELGVKLFERKGKSIALNQYGTILLRHTQRIIQEMAEIERDLSEAKGGGHQDRDHHPIRCVQASAPAGHGV